MLKTVIGKIHLYLGLLASIVLMIIGVSGATLSYEKELLKIFNPSSFSVEVVGKPLDVKELVEKFQEQKPKAQISGITIFSEPKSSYIISIDSKKSRKGKKVYINPYTAEILPEVSGAGFFKFTEDLHRRLTFGEVGKQIVGASVLMLITLLISGVYVYLPKIKKGFFASYKINRQAKGKSFLSSMHGAIGMWIIPFYLTTSLTGLYWSYEWYANTLFTISGVEKPDKSFKKGGNKGQRELKTAQEIHTAVEQFKSAAPDYSMAMMFLPKKGDVYRVFYLDKEPAHVYARNSLMFKLQTQEILKHERYNDKTVGGKFMGSMLALHTGEFFGIVGQLLVFLAALMMPVLAITGFMIYMKKRKRKAV